MTMKEKLFMLFKHAHDKLDQNVEDYWVDFCTELGVILLDTEWVVEYWNNDEYNNFICIPNPEVECIPNPEVDYHGYDCCPWLLIPPEEAERFVVLNYLPMK